ncbi:MAG: hypothetical protein RSC43_01265 [Clostridia bacterium]
MNIFVKFFHRGMRGELTLENRVNYLIGDTATGKTFMHFSTISKCRRENSTKDLNVAYYGETATLTQIEIAESALRADTLAILDEAFIKSLIREQLLFKFLTFPATFIVISRSILNLSIFPISPRQIYTMITDNNVSSFRRYVRNWNLPQDVHSYISEDTKSGNKLWSETLNPSFVKKSEGIGEALQVVSTSSEIIGCIDTLSISSALFLFTELLKHKTVPVFNVPSAEYLLAQALLSTQEVDDIIYSTLNPEKTCVELVYELTDGRYDKSRTTSLLCPTHCAECRSRTCRGKRIDVLSKIRLYLKEVHPEYTFPWELVLEFRTSKFK